MATPRRPHTDLAEFLFGTSSYSNTSLIDQARTFDNWPRRQEFKLSEFLALGFYHVNTGVRCSRCALIQADWSPQRPLLLQHCEFNVDCPLVLDFVNNPLVHYYYRNSQLMQDLQVALLNDTINTEDK